MDEEQNILSMDCGEVAIHLKDGTIARITYELGLLEVSLENGYDIIIDKQDEDVEVTVYDDEGDTVGEVCS